MRQDRGFGLQTLCFAQTLSFVGGSEGLWWYEICSLSGSWIIADPEKYFQELISEKLLILLRDGLCLELIIVSSNFQALLLWQEKLLESVWKRLISVKKS